MPTVTIECNFGPNTLIADLSGFVADITTVCSFGSGLQRIHDRTRAELAVFRQDYRFREFYSYGFGAPNKGQRPYPEGVPVLAGFERAVADYLEEVNASADADVRVQRLTYSNPIELIIGATGLVLLASLRLVRDWSARRRLNDAVAREYESAARMRDDLRRFAVAQLASGRSSLTADQVTDLITPDVERALKALGDSPISITGLDEGDELPSEPE